MLKVYFDPVKFPELLTIFVPLREVDFYRLNRDF